MSEHAFPMTLVSFAGITLDKCDDATEKAIHYTGRRSQPGSIAQ